MPVKKIKSQKSNLKSETKKASSNKPIARSHGLSAPIYDAKGAKNGTLTLPKEVFGAKINDVLMAQAVRVYLANQRQGNAKAQTRGEVSLTTAKWYRQKGTGRARHGAKSAPIFVGGGAAHGPRVRDYSLSMPQKMKKAALFSALSQKQKDGEIRVLSGLIKIEPKTKNMSQIIKKVTQDAKGKTKVLLVTSANPSEISNVYRAGRNIKNMEMISASLLNTYQVLKHRNLFFMKESVEKLGGSK